MKQLIYIPGNTAPQSGRLVDDLTLLNKNELAVYRLGESASITDSATKNFAIALGRGANNQPLVFPEVDIKSLTVVKAISKPGDNFFLRIVPTNVTVGAEYGFVLAKKGVGFNERNTWHFSVVAKNSTVTKLLQEFEKLIKANAETSNLCNVSIQGHELWVKTADTDYVTNYSVAITDGFNESEVIVATSPSPAILDKKYVQDLASRCAAGKGFNLTGEDVHEMYPGYPETIEDAMHTMYTLRFAVPRVAAKQRDEVVYQIVHLVCNNENEALISYLDTIFAAYLPKGNSAGRARVLSLDEDENPNDGK